MKILGGLDVLRVVLDGMGGYAIPGGHIANFHSVCVYITDGVVGRDAGGI